MTIIQHKRGTSSNWTSSNPTLAVGEIGYETNTGKFKIGDGTTAWSGLSYFSTSAGGSGTVTSVSLTLPTGLTVSGSPITTSGTLAISFDTGYSIPTTAKQTEWDTAYGWGNHASAGYQAGDADLTAIAALSANGLLRKTAGTWGMDSATYLTSYTETSTLSDVTGRGATTNTAISITNNTSSTTTTTGALKVTGGVGIVENLNVGGNVIVTGDLTVDDLTVNGTTTTINSTVVTVDDPIFTLGGDTAPGSDDNKDRGIAFRWHNGSTAKIGFFGFDDSTQYFTFVPDATITSEVISGSTGTISANLNGNATSADTLSTARNLWGQSFNGSGDITGSLTSVGDITSSDAIFSIGTTSVSTITGNRIELTGGTTSNTVGTGGYVSLTGGSATASTGANFGGNVSIAAGASTLSASGTGGSVSILAGDGATKGSISIGTSNTSAITIGASGITTTVAGTLSASLNTLTISSPLSGTSYNGSSAVSIGLSTAYGDTQNPYGTKTQGYVLAGPTTPTPATPTFRALISTDIPDLSATYLPLTGGSISGQLTSTHSSTWSSPAIIIGGSQGAILIKDTDSSQADAIIGTNAGSFFILGDTASDGTFDTTPFSINLTSGSATILGDVAINGGDLTSSQTTFNMLTGTTTTLNLATAATTAINVGTNSGGTLTLASPNITLSGFSGSTGLLKSTAGVISVDTSTYLTSASTLTAGNLNGTIPTGVLGNSSLNIGTTSVALNRSSANLALTGITSVTGGTGTTAFSLLSADTSGSASGAVLLSSGEAASSTAGTVKVDTGNNGTPGSGGANVSIGTTNASSVTIGRSGITTTIAGTLSATVSNATSADTVKTVSTATNATFYPIFVDANNGTATSESLYTDGGFIYNPSTNNLSIGGNFAVNGGDITTNLTTFNLVTTGVTTLNIGGAATAVTLGATTGTTTVGNSLVLATGTATLAPLDFVAGTNLTTPASGAFEYDGLTFYGTPAAGGRAVDMLGHYYVLSAVQGPDDTETAVSMLDGSTLGITVAAGTTYQIEVVAPIQHTYIGSAAATTSFGFTSTTVTGSPTASFTYQIRYGSNISGFTAASAENVAWRTTGSQLVGAAISTGSRYIQCHVTGILRVTGTGTVKVYPIITQSATGNTAYAQAGSYFRLTPIGNGTVNSIGTWS